MSDQRFDILVGLLLDGEMSDAEATELAAELRRNPARCRDARRQLALWDLWSQNIVSERSADAFLASWQTRLAAEQDAGAFASATMAKIDHERSQTELKRARPLLRASSLGWMAGAMAAVLTVVLWLGVPRTTAAVTTLRGEAVCPACVLHEGSEHLPALRISDRESTRVVYLTITPAVVGLQDRFCAGPTPAIVRGSAVERAERPAFAAESIVLPRREPADEQNRRVIFPL